MVQHKRTLLDRYSGEDKKVEMVEMVEMAETVEIADMVASDQIVEARGQADYSDYPGQAFQVPLFQRQPVN